MDSWFSEETSRWFAYLAFLAFFSLLGPYAAQGRGRRLVMTIWGVLVAAGVACLAAAVAALWVGQPEHVVRPLAVAGGVVTVVFGALYRTLSRSYQEAELRRIVARDL